jgi:hypothetical protein
MFGYDHSKYKPPRVDYGETSEEIQMDSFVQQKDSEYLSGEQERPPTGLVIDDRRPINPTRASPGSRASSPAPFTHYTPEVVTLAANEKREHHLRKADDGDDGAGCCKCVIM